MSEHAKAVRTSNGATPSPPLHRFLPILKRLQHRKLFHWCAAYLAGAWLLLQVIQVVGDFFGWPGTVGRIATLLLAVGFFATLVLAWYHGERGAQRVGAVEVGMFATLAVLAGVGVAFVGRDARPGVFYDDAIDPRSVAVLPFESLSSDRSDDYFTAGFHDELITRLSQVVDLMVISRTSVMGYRGTAKNLRQIAQELGVANVVEGSVQKAGSRVRVTAQLIDARTDRHIWAATYDRDISDLFAIQAELALRIAADLEATLTPAQQVRLHTKLTRNPAAHDLYMRARSARSADSAVALFEAAIQLDPTFAAAYADLSIIHIARIESGGIGGELADSGMALARRALSLDSTYAPAYRALGLNLRHLGRLNESTAAIRRALDMDPHYGAAMGSLGVNEAMRGNLDESIVWTLRAASLDPRQPQWYTNIGEDYVILGDYVAAAHAFEQSVEIRPSAAAIAQLARLDLVQGRIDAARRRAAELLARNPTGVQSLIAAGEAAAAAGDWHAARTFWQRLYRLHPNESELGRWSARVRLAVAMLHTGQTDAANQLLAEELRWDSAQVQNGADLLDYPLRIAGVYALRGDTERALDWLTRAQALGWVESSRQLFADPVFASIRDHPRFTRLAAQMHERISAMRARIAASQASSRRGSRS